MAKVYRIITAESEVYWMDEKEEILDSFGTCLEITEYTLTNPKDVTDEVNGQYYLD